MLPLQRSHIPNVAVTSYTSSMSLNDVGNNESLHTTLNRHRWEAVWEESRGSRRKGRVTYANVWGCDRLTSHLDSNKAPHRSCES